MEILKVKISIGSAMIIARLRGGLGNQLFQYAAAKSLAEHFNTGLKVDLYTYEKHPYRKFELHNFQIPVAEATRSEVHAFTGSNKIVRYLNKRENYFRCPKVFAQPHYHFYEDFFKLPSELYLSGYWQSEKYFHTIRDKILAWYVPAVPLDGENYALSERITNSNSVSLHVRRGDYSSSEFSGFYGGLTDDYYKKAIALIKERVENPEFFIFSDSIDWCRANLSLDSAVYVDINQGALAYRDLVLMSACHHNIIANSTFSWWGAWLNRNPSKVVVAPQRWFLKEYSEKTEPVYPCRYYNTKDIIPDQWLKI